MSWTVHYTKPGSDAVVTRHVPYLGATLLYPRSHRDVRWFTYVVFDVVSVDTNERTAIARFSHYRKDHLDKPRNPARLPK